MKWVARWHAKDGKVDGEVGNGAVQSLPMIRSLPSTRELRNRSAPGPLVTRGKTDFPTSVVSGISSSNSNVLPTVFNVTLEVCGGWIDLSSDKEREGRTGRCAGVKACNQI